MAVTWTWYVARTRMNIDRWLKDNNIGNKTDFVGVLFKLGITPPSVQEMESLFPSETSIKAQNDEKQWGIVGEVEPEQESTPTIEPKVVQKKEEKTKTNKWGMVEKSKRKKSNKPQK